MSKIALCPCASTVLGKHCTKEATVRPQAPLSTQATLSTCTPVSAQAPLSAEAQTSTLTPVSTQEPWAFTWALEYF